MTTATPPTSPATPPTAAATEPRVQFDWVHPEPSEAELLALRAALTQHLDRHFGPTGR